MTTVDNNQDTLDSRDIQECIDELEEGGTIPIQEVPQDKEPANFDQEESEELQQLLDFKEEVNSSEWDDGLTLISESYFEDYAQELAEDIGAISRDTQWPLNCIDWE